MTTRDNAAGKKVEQLLNPASYTTTQTTASVRLKGAGSVMLGFLFGDVTAISGSPGANGSWTVELEESDDDSIFTTIVEAARVLIAGAKAPVVAPHATTGVFATIDAAAHINSAFHVGVISSKEYVRAVITAVATPEASLIAVVAIKEHLAATPASN